MSEVIEVNEQPFVGREAEMVIILTAYQKLQNPHSGRNLIVLNFYGPTGIGKSALLDSIPLNSSQIVRIATDSKPVDIQGQIDKFNGTVVVLVDDIHRLRTDQSSLLEQAIIESAYGGNKILLICTSLYAKRTWKWKIRKDVAEIHSLGNLTLPDLEKLFDSQDTAGLIYSFTFGHPLASRRLAEVPTSENLESAFSQVVEKILASSIYKLEIEQEWKARLLEIAKLSSVLRYISFKTLAPFIRQTFMPQGQEEDGITDQTLQHLQAAGIIEWDIDENCYRFVPQLRPMLIRELALSPESFFDSHNTALKNLLYILNLHYKSSKYPAINYIPEILYHLSEMSKALYNEEVARQQELTIDELLPTLKEIIEHYSQNVQGEILSALQNDPDLQAIDPDSDVGQFLRDVINLASE